VQPPDRTADDLGIGRARATRLRNALVRAGVASVDQLRSLAAGRIGAAPGLGPNHVRLVRQLLARNLDRGLQDLLDEVPLMPPPAAGPRLLLEREREVLRLRHPVPGQARLTFQEIAERLGVSPARVRQLHARGLEKLGRARVALLRGEPVREALRADLIALGHALPP
jgi:DNA-binding CsgD family transcriptional regulator